MIEEFQNIQLITVESEIMVRYGGLITDFYRSIVDCKPNLRVLCDRRQRTDGFATAEWQGARLHQPCSLYKALYIPGKKKSGVRLKVTGTLGFSRQHEYCKLTPG